MEVLLVMFLVPLVLVSSASSFLPESKTLGLISGSVLEVVYEPTESYNDAKNACLTKGGHLALLRTSEETAFVDERLFFSGSLDPVVPNKPRVVPSFYWFGFSKRQSKWVFGDGVRLEDNGYENWDHEQPAETEKSLSCAGLKRRSLRNGGNVVWKRERCKEKHAYICQYDPEVCVAELPDRENNDYISQEEDGFACKPTSLSALRRIGSDNCKCKQEPRIQRKISGEHSCGLTVFWDKVACLPACRLPPTPRNAVLVDPTPSSSSDLVLLGWTVTYFCPGYFTGTDEATNVLQIPCEDKSKAASSRVQCVANDEDGKNANVKLVYVMFGNQYVLFCNHVGTVDSGFSLPVKEYIWIKDHRRLHASFVADDNATVYKYSGDQLIVTKLGYDGEGVYTCFARYKNALLPGGVYKLTTGDGTASSAHLIAAPQHLVLSVLAVFVLTK